MFIQVPISPRFSNTCKTGTNPYFTSERNKSKMEIPNFTAKTNVLLALVLVLIHFDFLFCGVVLFTYCKLLKILKK